MVKLEEERGNRCWYKEYEGPKQEFWDTGFFICMVITWVCSFYDNLLTMTFVLLCT